MVKRLAKNKKGQSILEYLVVATIIVAAIAIIRPTLQANFATLFTNAAAQTANAGTKLGAVVPE